MGHIQLHHTDELDWLHFSSWRQKSVFYSEFYFDLLINRGHDFINQFYFILIHIANSFASSFFFSLLQFFFFFFWTHTQTYDLILISITLFCLLCCQFIFFYFSFAALKTHNWSIARSCDLELYWIHFEFMIHLLQFGLNTHRGDWLNDQKKN